MKIKVHRSKISNKRFQKIAFPRYSRKDFEDSGNNKEHPSITKAAITRNSATYTETSVIGCFAIKNLKEITLRMKDDPDTFGRYLNKLVSTYNDIVLSDDGMIGKFSGTGAMFAFKFTSNPRDAIIKTLVAALKMRYVLNKFNREWDQYHGNAWQVGLGINFGDVEFLEDHDSKPYVSMNGRTSSIAKGISRSAGSSQVLITESMYLQFPFLETSFDVKPPRHVPVLGQKFVSKIREVVGMVGPQAKKIYEVYV